MKKKILAGAVSLILIMNSFSAITVAAETKSAESVTESYKESTESDITLSENAGSGGESSSGKNSDADSSAGTVSEDTVSEGSSTEETPFDAASYGSAFTASAKPTEDAGIEAGVYSIASKIDTRKSLAVKGDGCASDIPIVLSGSASMLSGLLR